ncbi:MAG: ATP synthase F1 subunit delta [Armatimonadetes bacterium]|nr:ATP synthase F1 subunit delta [Armatimonadota bacterium]
MLLRTIAFRYAEALFKLAVDRKNIDDQLKELVTVERILQEHPSLKRALEAPTVPGSVKKRILKELLERRLDKTTLHFFYVLVDKNREVYVTTIIEAYRGLMRAHRGVVQCHVRTAVPLTADLTRDLTTSLGKYTGKKVELQVELAPELLGGMVIRVGDRIIDASLESQLEHIRERLLAI